MASSRKTATNENISTYGAAGSGRDYTAFATWEAATDVDLVTATQSEVLECYDDAASFDDYCPLLGATTNSSYFRIIRPASGQGHDGTPNNGFNIANTTNAVVFSLYEDNSQVQDIIAKSAVTSALNRSVFQSTQSGCAFVGCIAYDSVLTATSANMYGFFASPDGATSDVAFFIDCIAINITTTGTGVGNGFQDNDDGVVNWYNCTAVNNQNYGFSQGSATCNAKNCCSSGNTVADWTGTITKTTCTAEGAAPTYADAAGDDFHLAAADTVCRGNGTDLSSDANYPFNDDIDGETRLAWDIGFDEYSAGTSTGLQDMKTDIELAGWGRSDAKTDLHAGRWGYAHTILDLSAYFQKLEDMKLDLEAWRDKTQDARIDGIVAGWGRSDAKTDLHTGRWGYAHTILDLSAYFQKLEDMKLDISLQGLQGWAFAYLSLDIYAGAQALESMHICMHAAMITLNDAMLDLFISGGDSFQDNRLDIEITDGIKLHDAGLDLAVIEVMPSFKAVYAMHLDSVITEI